MSYIQRMPELDNVRVDFKRSDIAVEVIAWIITIFLISWIADKTLPDFLAGVITVVAITSLIHFIDSGLVETDDNGIIIHSRIFKKFIQWSNVKQLEIKKASDNVEHAYLVTERKSIQLPDDAFKDPAMMASIWQHLWLFGKADESTIPSAVRAVMFQVSESIPEEISWELNDLTAQSIGIRSFSVTFEAVSSQPLDASENPTIIRWIDVESADFTSDLGEVWELVITSSDKLVSLPLDEEDSQSMLLILSAVRRLRKTGYSHPIRIPKKLVELYESSQPK